MTRETVIQNIMNNYGKYGITQDMVEEVIDAGTEGGMSYDLIYLDTCRRISEITGEEFVCTSSDMAKAFNVSDEEMDKIIEEAREELIESGENPDECFRSVQSTRYMMQQKYYIWSVSQTGKGNYKGVPYLCHFDLGAVGLNKAVFGLPQNLV